MRCSILRRPAATDMSEWANPQTEKVDGWLMAEGVRPLIARLVVAWNEHDLLGIDLADELRDLVETKLREEHEERAVQAQLQGVDWGQLAEEYALRFCGVTEEDLTARRERYLADS